MTPTLVQRSTVAAVVLAMSAGVSAQTRLVVPVDPNLGKQISVAVRTAEDDGNYATALREQRRWLEVYPNEPLLQAAIYQAMSATAEKSGDAKAAAEFAAVAKTLDPTLAGRLQAEQGTTTTRADKTDKIMAAMGVAMATMAAIQQARQQLRDTRAPQQPMAPPQGQPQPYAYPPAPVGAPGYQPPVAPQPMPGYAPAGYAPPGSAQPPAGAYTPPGGGYTPPGYPPQQSPPPAAYAPPAGYAPPGYYPPPDPNTAPANYAPAAAVRRGDAFKPIRVVHDHSLANAPAYFANACGALLSVDGTTLTFTPGGGEAPRVIPATDIREMRMNTTVGRDVGAFHIATKQGLYLHLAPESGKAEDARAIIDALTKALGL